MINKFFGRRLENKGVAIFHGSGETVESITDYFSDAELIGVLDFNSGQHISVENTSGIVLNSLDAKDLSIQIEDEE